MAELADAPDLESGAERLAGSTPVTRTILISNSGFYSSSFNILIFEKLYIIK